MEMVAKLISKMEEEGRLKMKMVKEGSKKVMTFFKMKED